jgi:hypothetical protein
VTLEFRDPPPPGKGRRLFTDEVLAELRAHPGRWAVIREYTSTATASSHYALRKVPVDIELRAVIEPPGSVLYARAKAGR